MFLRGTGRHRLLHPKHRLAARGRASDEPQLYVARHRGTMFEGTPLMRPSGSAVPAIDPSWSGRARIRGDQTFAASPAWRIASQAAAAPARRAGASASWRIAAPGPAGPRDRPGHQGRWPQLRPATIGPITGLLDESLFLNREGEPRGQPMRGARRSLVLPDTPLPLSSATDSQPSPPGSLPGCDAAITATPCGSAPAGMSDGRNSGEPRLPRACHSPRPRGRAGRCPAGSCRRHRSDGR